MSNKCCGTCNHLVNAYCTLYSVFLATSRDCLFVRCAGCLSHKTHVLPEKENNTQSLVMLDKPGILKVTYNNKTNSYIVIVKDSSSVTIHKE